MKKNDLALCSKWLKYENMNELKCAQKCKLFKNTPILLKENILENQTK